MKECGFSSIQAIRKYIAANYKNDLEEVAPFIKKYLKGASGFLKLAASSSTLVAKSESGEKKKSSVGTKTEKLQQ